MATKTIGQLTTASAINSADYFEIEQGGVSKKIDAQTMGVIIDKGTSTYGSYIKWSDGTMIQYNRTVSGNVDNVVSNFYGSTSGNTEYANLSIVYPIAFYNVPVVTSSVVSPSDVMITFRTAPTEVGAEFRLLSGVSSGTATIGWQAIGRWEA